MTVIGKYGIQDQTKSLVTTLTSEKWVKTVATGTDDEIVKGLGEALDPLARKLLQTSGAGFADTLPKEMIDWVKDSTLIVNEYRSTFDGQLTDPAKPGDDSAADKDRGASSSEIEALKEYYDA